MLHSASLTSDEPTHTEPLEPPVASPPLLTCTEPPLDEALEPADTRTSPPLLPPPLLLPLLLLLLSLLSLLPPPLLLLPPAACMSTLPPPSVP